MGLPPSPNDPWRKRRWAQLVLAVSIAIVVLSAYTLGLADAGALAGLVGVILTIWTILQKHLKRPPEYESTPRPWRLRMPRVREWHLDDGLASELKVLAAAAAFLGAMIILGIFVHPSGTEDPGLPAPPLMVISGVALHGTGSFH